MPTDTNPTGRQIRRAQQQGARELSRFMEQQARDLRLAHEETVAAIQADLALLADSDGRIPLQNLRQAETVVRNNMDDLHRRQEGMVENGLRRSAGLGVAAWGGVSAAGLDPSAVRDEVLAFVREFRDANGLQLSDRLWRVSRGAREQVENAIERAIVEGHSAAQAARDLVLRGQSVPQDLISKRGMAAVARIQREAGDALLTGSMSPFFQAERVMRTEINRAYGETAIAAAAQHPDVIAVRFTLSPLHPEPDICDFHAEANLHGLGPGIYPIDDHPWPAHPNTLSYLEPVFRDEITDEDRAGRQTITDYINTQSAPKQDAILGGQAKGWAWRQGHLSPRQLQTPWRNIRPRLQRRGIDIPEPFAR